jgi:hypothetical protein
MYQGMGNRIINFKRAHAMGAHAMGAHAMRPYLTHHPQVPAPPLNGPTILDVIHPP